MAKRISCINKRSHGSPHERISHVGGAGWKTTEDDAIRSILNGTETYYVSVNGQAVDVVVASHNNRRYLKTKNDGYEPNNLLSLPECP